MGRSSGKKLQNLAKTRGAIFGKGFSFKKDIITKTSLLIHLDSLRSKGVASGIPKPVGQNILGVEADGKRFFAIDFSNEQIEKCRFIGCRFSNKGGKNLLPSVFNNTDIIRSDFSGSYFEENSFRGASFSGSVFSNSAFQSVSFKNANFSSSSGGTQEINKFKNVYFTNCNFIGTNATKTIFSDSRFESFTANSADFSYSVFERARIAHSDLSGALFQSTFAGNLCILKTRLNDTSFFKSDLSGASFDRCSGGGVSAPPSFEGVRAKKAVFGKCNFPGAIFKNASLEGAVFTETDLVNADFKDANLKGVKFINCDLDGIKFSDQQLKDADFID